METRIKNKVIDINLNSTFDFWQSRVNNGDNLKTVLLNVDADDELIQYRNTRETNILKSILPSDAKITILDIGCGIGRWVDNLYDYIKEYDGIDYTEGFIKLAKDKYPQENIRFHNQSITNLDKSLLLKNYDLSIITGVCMYLNDTTLPELFTNLGKLTSGTVYIQESVSLTDERLTLDKFYSEDLHQNYSAIYRQPDEYKKLIQECCADFTIYKSGLLLDEETGARHETNAAYWILKR
ncbi:MAG: class I SAM-dependent methyltransferase [Fusobacterium sp.]|nr:class I SAM-dependent methyltransferase [Fusobacterium sp.]